MLQIPFARQRQQRLLAILAQKKVDAAVISWTPHVQYFSTHLAHWAHHAAFILFADGRSWLATANRPPKSAAADQIVAYEASWNATMRSEQPMALADLIVPALTERKAKRIAMDASVVNSQVMMRFDGECSSIDPDLWQLRRRKDPDELDLMRTAVRLSETMYDRARQMIEPGIDELRVFNEFHAAAVEAAQEPLSALLGNDFTCGGGGGPPRAGRKAQSGELYILDLGPAYRGYFADNARAISVDRHPTDAQLQAWQGVTGALAIVERLAKPGVRCRDIVAAVDEHMAARFGKPMSHHLGHGVGLQPHEYPHLNPKWDDTLLEGEVFTAEPGAYGAHLGGGMRLENEYLVTADGVENLMSHRLDLV